MAVYQFTVVIEPDEDVFHAYVPTLPGCHTFGATVDEARANIAEAITLHIESIREDGEMDRLQGAAVTRKPSVPQELKR